MIKVKLNEEGIREILNGAEARALVDEVAEQIAVQVRATGVEVEVQQHTTDRAVARILTPFWDQAAHGVLTRAAANLGLEIKAAK